MTSNLLHRWPSALGLGCAVLVLVAGAGREVLAIVLGVAVLCYLTAAATQRRWMAWVGIAAGSLVVAASELAGLPWWAGLGVVAVALVAGGLVGGVPRVPLTAQTVALLGYGGLAVTAVLVVPAVGMVLAGLALAAHGVWDVIHHRRDEVVPRSLAEFCVLLDVPLGLGFLALAATGTVSG
ncbi:hypothetical protein O7543_22465 [Solwaraspora sp. WMMA2080]|uniref:hypothetical protein n=1 Tax=unclassified Solwaraspora TaxID=2627926 RepID=UPI00248CDFB2|nr:MULTISPECIES: hypothetical protein [unclassified Solwaraspora]WBB96511.1 hypothetical protein O7553_24900 [Solwaraspora sp. WMMA2059]WBC19584.1 hypothetical protein O7543_22465 [Solwaraspora sp. WMMA2080]